MKSTVRNLDVCLKQVNETNNRETYSKINTFPNLFNTVFKKHRTSFETHVLKWVDGNGHVNLAFQLIRSNSDIMNRANDQDETSYSLVFSFNSMNTIALSIVHIITSNKETLTANEDLGTYRSEELNEAFIIRKIEQFIESIAD